MLIGEGGHEEAARRSLIRVGLDHIAGYLAGGMAAWIDAGLPLARTTQLATAEVLRRAPEALVMDVRSDTEWAGGAIEGAQHIMLGDLLARKDEIPRDRPLMMVCGSGYRSSIAASLLQREGFRDVSSMAGGMQAWRTQQLRAVARPFSLKV